MIAARTLSDQEFPAEVLPRPTNIAEEGARCNERSVHTN
jgi:hypothetical protein